jgi:hypothetical protein
MSVQALKALVDKLYTTVEVAGQQFRLRKFAAKDGIELVKLLESMGYGTEGGPEDTPERLAELHRFAAMSSVVDESGVKCLLDGEGKELLEQLPLADLVSLGEHALRWNGWDVSADAESKKNSPLTTNSPTSYVEPSPPDTAHQTNC